MEIKDLIALRKRIKARKPEFIRQDLHKKSALKKKWRRPKGLHSKLRLNVRGKLRSISQGYRSPKKVRGMHKSGLIVVIIKSEQGFKELDPKKHGLIVSSSIGNKKRVSILKKTKELGFNVLNFRNPDGFIKKVEDRINVNKKQKREEEKKTKEQTKKKERKLAEKVNIEDKKEVEKKEKDKLLTKRER